MTSGTSIIGSMSAEERYFFDLYGYLVRYDALDPAEVAELNRSIDALDVPRPGTTIQDQRFTGFLEADRVFRDLIDHPAILEPILELCGSRARLDHAYGIHMAPGTTGLSLHGGGTPHDPCQFYEVVGGTIFNGLVAVQWPLVDQGPGVGGFRCVPGSHRASFPVPARLPQDWVVDVSLSAGDVVIFTEALTHGTAPWSGSTDRRSLLYKYSPGHLAWSSQHTTTLAELSRRDDLTDVQRRLLVPPYSGGHPAVLG